VTATDEVNGIFKKANHCSSTCVAAPGVDVVVGSGTSLAAAQVSGVVALLRDAKPDLTPKQVRELLFKAVKQISPTDPDEKLVVGVVDTYKALDAVTGVGRDDRVLVPVPLTEVSRYADNTLEISQYILISLSTHFASSPIDDVL
jgi:subtilisin family serine protease